MKTIVSIFLIVYLIAGEVIVWFFVKDAFLAYNIGLAFMGILIITISIMLALKKKGG